MAGNATLDPDVLVDSLVPDVIDGLRGSLHPQFGVRAYRVFVEKREYTGKKYGEGQLTTTEIEIDPQPKVMIWNKDLRYELAQCGLDEMGEIKITEVSLTYNFEDLTGRNQAGDDLGQNAKIFIRLEEAHGQGNPPRYFQHTRPPFVDRIKDMGWAMWLRAANV